MTRIYQADSHKGEEDIRKCLPVLGPLKTTPPTWNYDGERRELSIGTDLTPHLAHFVHMVSFFVVQSRINGYYRRRTANLKFDCKE